MSTAVLLLLAICLGPPYPAEASTENEADSCTAANGEDFVLSDDTILGPRTHEACHTITAGPNLGVVGPDGDLVLFAGDSVILRNGFYVGTDAKLTIGSSSFEPCTGPCRVFCGSGVIEDFAFGGTIALAAEDLVHVLLLPEGYTASEIDAGVFDSDVADWLAEWRAIETYAAIQQAFCIWKWPIASNEHVAPTSPQTADTAFLVPITSDGNSVHSSLTLDSPTAGRVWDLMDTFPFPPTSFYPPGGRTSRIAKNLVVSIMVYDVDTGRSGLFGRSRRFENPDDSSQRISVALAHNRPHEFSHAFSRVQDEYVETCCGALGVANALAIDSPNVLNVVTSPQCGTLPWDHLAAGGTINPSTHQLIGAFGLDGVGFHPELRCLMNGTHDNAAVYGGNGNLRSHDRLCNFCRELTVFRLLERIHVLDDPSTSYATWIDDYRDAFYDHFGFKVPAPVPQENSVGTPIYDPCEAAAHSFAAPLPEWPTSVAWRCEVGETE